MDIMKHPALWKIVLALLTVYIVWGSTYLAIRIAVLGLPAFLFCGARYLVAGGIMLLFGLLLKQKWPDRNTFIHACISGLLLLFGGNGTIAYSEKVIPSNLGALIVATLPVWLLIFEGLRKDGDRPTWFGIVSIPVGFFGVFTLLGPQTHSNPWYMLLALIGAAVWALGQTYTRHTQMPTSYIYGNAIAMLAASVAFLLASLVSGELQHANWGHFPLSSIAAWAYLVVFGSCVAYSAFTWLVTNATPAQVSTYAYVNPLVAVILGAMVLHEPVSPRMILGAVLVLISVGLAQAKGPSPFGKRDPARVPSGCNTRSC